MRFSVEVRRDGRHVYTWEYRGWGLYRFRIGTGRWRYTLSRSMAEAWCEYALDKVRLASLRPEDFQTPTTVELNPAGAPAPAHPHGP